MNEETKQQEEQHLSNTGETVGKKDEPIQTGGENLEPLKKGLDTSDLDLLIDLARQELKK